MSNCVHCRMQESSAATETITIADESKHVPLPSAGFEAANVAVTYRMWNRQLQQGQRQRAAAAFAGRGRGGQQMNLRIGGTARGRGGRDIAAIPAGAP